MRAKHSTPATPDQWALRWLKALPGGDSNVRAAFTCWMRHSPRYVEAYCRQKMLDTELRGLDPERRIDVKELVRRARVRIRAEGTVVRWPGEVGVRAPPRLDLPRGEEEKPKAWAATRVGFVALVFSMLVLMVLPRIVFDLAGGGFDYTTELGQQRRVGLPDGSTAMLNTQSRVVGQFSSQRREVRLLHGEVMFSVVHDARRPFRVYVGNSIVEDVGTRFDVRVGDGGTTVVVVEGRVRLMRSFADGMSAAASSSADSPVVLARGDEAFVSGGGTQAVAHLSARELRSATAWTEGLVILDGMTLPQAVREFNRYNRVKLQLADGDGDVAGGLTLGGSFDFTMPLVFAESLRRLGCEVSSGEEGVVVISKCNSRPAANVPEVGVLR